MADRWIFSTCGPRPLHLPEHRAQVQQWLEEDDDVSDDEYEVVTCPACAKIHLLNRKTGKPLGQQD